MKLYHPMAVYIDERDRKAKTLFSYDSCLTMDEATKVIDRWRNDCDFQTIVEFIQIYEGDLIEIVELTNSGNPMEQFKMASPY